MAQDSNSKPSNPLIWACLGVAGVFIAVVAVRVYLNLEYPARLAKLAVIASGYAGFAAIVAGIVLASTERSQRAAGATYLAIMLLGCAGELFFVAADFEFARDIARLNRLEGHRRALDRSTRTALAENKADGDVAAQIGRAAAAVGEAADTDNARAAAQLTALSEFLAELEVRLAVLEDAKREYARSFKPFPAGFTAREELTDAIAAADAYVLENEAVADFLRAGKDTILSELEAAGLHSWELGPLEERLSDAGNLAASLGVREAEAEMGRAARSMLEILERHWGAWTPSSETVGGIAFRRGVPEEDIEAYFRGGQTYLRWAQKEAALQAELLKAGP